MSETIVFEDYISLPTPLPEWSLTMFPLANRRILVTRSRHQASELTTRLEALGATTILIPTIEIAPPITFAALDEAMAHLNRFDWLVFTSANAVDAFRQRFAGRDSRNLAHTLTAVIGPATARVATQVGLNVVLIPPEAVAESLTAALIPRISPGTSILLVRAAVARDHLPEVLTAAGAEVTIAEAYRTLIPQASVAALKEVFDDRGLYPDVITFTSSSTVSNLMTLLEVADLTLPPSIIRASIGPITTRTLHEHGFPAHLQAPNASIASLAESLVEYIVDNA